MSGDLRFAADGSDVIGGDPEQVDKDARRMRITARRFEEMGNSLKRIRAEGWTGLAADAFEAEMRAHPKHWYHAADRLDEVANELETYADVLRGAIKKADRAVELYQQGARLHLEAAATPGVDTSGEPLLSREGTELQRKAQLILDNATHSVEVAGDLASEAIEHSTHDIADYKVPYGDSDLFGPRSKSFSCQGPEFISMWKMRLFQCDGYQNVHHDFDYQGSPFGIPLDLIGDGSAGMNANADATIGPDGAHIGAKGMFGGVYEIENDFHLFGQDVGLIGTAHLGPGASANATLGRDDEGNWHFQVKGSFSPLVGVGTGLDVPVPNPVVETLNDGLDEVKEHLPWP